VARERRRRKRVQSTAERINEVGEGRSNRAGHAADEVEAKNQWNLKMKMSRSSRWKKEHIAGNVARERRRRERVYKPLESVLDVFLILHLSLYPC
jgi:hypothetical protein